jgi:hypothetical protein
VAREHYLQVTDEHFSQASATAQITAQTVANSIRPDRTLSTTVSENVLSSPQLSSADSCIGGWGGIRTHGGLSPTPVFKTGALNRSATHPIAFLPRISNIFEEITISEERHFTTVTISGSAKVAVAT